MEQEQIQQARAYLRRRLDEEIAGQEKLKSRIMRTFTELLGFGFSGGRDFTFRSSPQKDRVEALFAELRTYIYMIIEDGCNNVVRMSQQENGSDYLLPVVSSINAETHGHTLKERISIYTGRLEYEMETWIAAALALGVGNSSLMPLWSAYRTKPYANPLFNEARRMHLQAARFCTGGVSYGNGRYVSSENNLIRLQRATVAQAMSLSDWEIYNRKGAIGYRVGRGSSYPCSLCDSMAGFHFLADITQMPPYHANCVCWYYPVYSTVGL